ncbi:putative protein yxeR [Proteiniborus sp. DW1]|uniref:ethanolamine utilization protein EutH n=1 Tax=Proteiniborus sp. DW1 TaxID=1889883 RepID=UPI00092E1363|nr:ethanolamine utilization protein EutH [Proteiniborus sp. DW1]SCG81992.1 putative protein yxeR [Proteiniborus sp. DW1]
MNDLILYTIFAFAVLGCIDKIIGNKFELGAKFTEGFLAMGNLAIPVIGIYALAPIIGDILLKITFPFFQLTNIDPSILPASIFAVNMGGYVSAVRMAQATEMGVFSGIILASTLGATVGFTIPAGVEIIEKEDQIYFAKGILAGVVTIPLGCIVGGVVLRIPTLILILNILPIMLIALIFAIGLSRWPNKLLRGFTYFSKVTTTIGALGVILSIFERISGLNLIAGLGSFDEGLRIVGSITVVLCGAFPMIHVITKVFKNSLMRLGNKVGVGENAIIAMLISLSSNVPAFIMMKDMNIKGKVLLSAFMVSGAFTFGGQLGFVASVDKTAIIPFIVAKIIAGSSAIILAMILMRESVEANI